MYTDLIDSIDLILSPAWDGIRDFIKTVHFGSFCLKIASFRATYRPEKGLRKE